MKAQITATTKELKEEGMFEVFSHLGIRTGLIVELDHVYNPTYVFSVFKWKNAKYTINTKFIQPC